MDVLRNRLEQKRPHKVYLALNLIQLVCAILCHLLYSTFVSISNISDPK